MSEVIYTGIDIGSNNIKIIHVGYNENTNKTRILHKHSYPSMGINNGYISNIEIFNQSFQKAIKKNKKDTGNTITDAVFTIDSVGVKSKKIKIIHQVVNQVSVTDIDIEEIKRKMLVYAEKEIKDKIIDFRLIKYEINNYDYYSDITGLEAKKIKAEYIFTFLPHNHITALEKVLFQNDVSILDINSGNIFSAEINLDKEDKYLGVINIDIGANKTSLSIWENSRMIFIDTIKYGSDDITKKISLDQKVSILESEKLKKNILKTNNKKIEKIITNSSKILAGKIEKILKDVKKGGKLFPAGVVVYGGGSKSNILIKVLKENLSMHIKKYTKTISDENTDFYNIYAGVISFIYKSRKKNNLFNINFIKKIFTKWF